MTAIGLGCVTFGREIDEAAAFAVLDEALGRGITLLDTAESYGAGASERVLGRYFAARPGARDRITLATKISGRLNAGRIRQAAEDSLRRLGTDRVDLYQLHAFDPETPLEETLAALQDLVARGVARRVGCSNFSAGQLRAALAIQDARGFARFASLQPCYNLVDRRIELETLPLCRAEGVGVVVYSPLAAGFLAGKYRRGEPPPTGTRFDVIPGHQRLYFTDTGFRAADGLRAIAARTSIPMVLLALHWVMTRPGLASVLVGARRPEQVAQAFAAQALDLAPDLLAEFDVLAPPAAT